MLGPKNGADVSVYRSIKNEALSELDISHPLAETVFGGYDHTLMQPDSVRLKQIGLSQMLRVRARCLKGCPHGH